MFLLLLLSQAKILLQKNSQHLSKTTYDLRWQTPDRPKNKFFIKEQIVKVLMSTYCRVMLDLTKKAYNHEPGTCKIVEGIGLFLLYTFRNVLVQFIVQT